MKGEADKATIYNQLRVEYQVEIEKLKNNTYANLNTGDVVKAKLDGMYFEGVIMQLNENGTVTVDFGEDDTHDIPCGDCRRVQSWEVLEVGDTVQVRDKESKKLFSTGTIVAVSVDPLAEPSYTVDYNMQVDSAESPRESGDEDDDSAAGDGGPDLEEGVSHDRVRKVATDRVTAVKRWKGAFRKVFAHNVFKFASTRTSLLAVQESPPGKQQQQQQRALSSAGSSSHLREIPDEAEMVADEASSMMDGGPSSRRSGATTRAKETDAQPPPTPPPAGAVVVAGGLLELKVGDVVSAKPPDEALAFEGVIVAFDAGVRSAQVHFGGTEGEGSVDMAWIPVADVKKVHNWDVSEIGDHVKAQPRDETLWFDATIVAIRMGGGGGIVYTVHWGLDEYDAAKCDTEDVEHDVTPDRIRKVESGRTFVHIKQWSSAFKVIKGARAFKGGALLKAPGASDKAKKQQTAAVTAAAAPPPQQQQHQQPEKHHKKQQRAPSVAETKEDSKKKGGGGRAAAKRDESKMADDTRESKK